MVWKVTERGGPEQLTLLRSLKEAVAEFSNFAPKQKVCMNLFHSLPLSKNNFYGMLSLVGCITVARACDFYAFLNRG